MKTPLSRQYCSIKAAFPLLVLLTLLGLGSCGVKQKKESVSYLQELNAGLMEAVVQDGFSPPVSSRVYAYPNIAAYEAAIHIDSGFRSYAGQLKGLDALPQPEKGKEYEWKVVMVQAFCDVARNMVYRDYIIDSTQGHLLKSIRAEGCRENVFDESISFGKTLGKAINDWAAKDNYKETRNYPKFTVTTEAGCWQPTAPKYMEALEPHWMKVRPFSLDSVSQFRMQLPYEYSTDTNSECYKIVKDVYQTSYSLDSDQKSCVKFWDDNPSPLSIAGHVVTTNRQNSPGGHWLCIARTIVREKKLNLAESCELYSKITIAIADAFKVVWDTKYVANNLRPCTYVCKVIDVNWSPMLETPNFPEFTSGHSAISHAAAYVLTERFGDNYSFTDSCNVPFGFSPRKFSSFNAAADEAAMSRVYGGIHYKISCDAGAEQGKAVGEWVSTHLQTRKKD